MENNMNIVLRTLEFKPVDKPFEGQIIDNEVLSSFKSTFNNPDRYLSYLDVLWKLRSMVIDQLERLHDAEQSDLYPVFKVLNDLIGVLCNSKIGFDLFKNKTGE